MISYIKGVIEDVFEDSVIIENNGIGYLVQAAPATIAKLVRGKEDVKLYTYMNVKENELSLFGFASSEDIKIFNLLISVSGIGPKSAMAIVASMTPSQIMLAIITEDAATLSKAPGVGKKTALRLILELKDKIKTVDSFIHSNTDSQQSLPFSASGNNEKQDATEALISLGYSRSEAVKAVMEVALEGMKAEQIIKLALKKLLR